MARPLPCDIPPPDPTPSLRLDTPLPPYRYVPGLHPHPFRHPDGHMYSDGSAPTEASEPDWDGDWLRGLDLFDHRFYWESHEVLEALWHTVPRDSVDSQLLQGLIQAAASVLKRHLGHQQSATRLQQRAHARLMDVRHRQGPVYRGLSLDALLEDLEEGDRWPRPLQTRPLH